MCDADLTDTGKEGCATQASKQWDQPLSIENDYETIGRFAQDFSWSIYSISPYVQIACLQIL